ncbi:hypothetical protein TcasGA2_TC007160 [Tribolium castaneum]|uniref:Uncharacterized protein n=1 Tax=Tribolium castaneum TaxID=7070 RepID=D2A118_TRICA|nr:hypothetical protein TcasGA2_TC007160 [Tribolium castaneum]
MSLLPEECKALIKHRHHVFHFQPNLKPGICHRKHLPGANQTSPRNELSKNAKRLALIKRFFEQVLKRFYRNLMIYELGNLQQEWRKLEVGTGEVVRRAFKWRIFRSRTGESSSWAKLVQSQLEL